MSGMLSSLYQNRFSETEILKINRVWGVLCSTFFSRFISKKSSVIEIGSGFGQFINNIKACNKTAVDMNEHCHKYLDKDVSFVHADSRLLKEMINQKFDVVFMSNFLEHLESKKALEETLDISFDLLNANGKLLILGPNLRYLNGKYWDFYDHSLPLTHLSLMEILRVKGYQIELCIDKFLPYSSKSKLPSYSFLVYLYLKCPLLWKFFGKQFFIVAKKAVNR